MIEVKICFLLGYEKQENDRDPIIVLLFRGYFQICLDITEEKT